MHLVRAAQCAQGSSTLSAVCCSIDPKGARPLSCAVVGDLEMRNQPPNQGAAANSRRAFRLRDTGNLEARRALHRRSPAAVAELGRWAT